MGHPITPPPELVREWARGCSPYDVPADHIATHAARWGAELKLEACLELLDINGCPSKWIDLLRAARRPNLPSLKERIASAIAGGKTTVALALLDEALPDD